MEKLYLIEGQNSIFITNEINKILNLNKNREKEIIKYDLKDVMIDDVIEALDTYDMFLKQKIIVCTSPIFLQEKVDDSFNIDKFLKYLKNPSDNILILVTDKINNRLKLVSSVLPYFKVIKVKELTPIDFIVENTKDYKMDKNTMQYFLTKVGNDYNHILQELTKLKTYKMDTKIISKEDINLVTTESIEASIFDLIEAILEKDKSKAYELYYHFINNGTEIFQILVLLCNQLRLIYNVKVLANLSDTKISEILEVKEYPVKLARKKGYNYPKEELLNLLYDLGEIDEGIKSGKQLADISFLTFIMQM